MSLSLFFQRQDRGIFNFGLQIGVFPRSMGFSWISLELGWWTTGVEWRFPE